MNYKNYVLKERLKSVKNNNCCGNFPNYDLTLEDCDFLYSQGVISISSNYLYKSMSRKPYLKKCCANFFEE